MRLEIDCLYTGRECDAFMRWTATTRLKAVREGRLRARYPNGPGTIARYLGRDILKLQERDPALVRRGAA